jgi:hypothetical protein
MKSLSTTRIHYWESRRAHQWLWAAILVALLLVSGWVTSVAQGAEFRQGSYSGTRLRGDTVLLKFDEKGRFALSDKNGKTLVEGAYKVTKDQIEFTDEKGPFAAKDAKPGKYKWKLEEKKLNFTKVEDESEGRSKGISGTTWTLEK